MSNSVFPTLPGLGWSAIKTPQWATKIQIATSGKELRSAWFSMPKYKYKLTYEVLRAGTFAGTAYTEFQTLIGFFNSRQGSFDSFLFTDPLDNSVTAQSCGTGNGVQTVFPLVRAYGGNVEPVMNINTITGVYVNGVLQTLGTQYTVDGYGNVTFASAPANTYPVTWTGTYYYRCRFIKDAVDFDQFMYQLFQLKELEFMASLGNKV